MRQEPAIVDPTTWGIDLPASFPEVRLDKNPIISDQAVRVDADWLPGGFESYLSASDSTDARQKAGWAYRDALAFAAMADWFDTRDERERQQVAHEFNADTEGNPLPEGVLVESLLAEIVRLRQQESGQ